MEIIFDLVWIVIAIVFTIAYFAFVTWNVFVSKKQIVMSVIDVMYFAIVAGIFCWVWSFHGVKFALIIVAALVLWSIILTFALERNKREKENIEIINEDEIILQSGGIIRTFDLEEKKNM